MNNTIKFAKPPTTFKQQITRLTSRGMVISDISKAENFLTQVNYYRFCGYALHYEIFVNGIRSHQYKAGTCFEDVCLLCEFDSKLRNLLFLAIEPIEVAFRTTVCHEMAITYNDAHWYLNLKLFTPQFEHNKLLADIQVEFDRSNEVFVQSYKSKNYSPALPAAWMLTEILPLGKWSRMYGGLASKDDQRVIAKRFNAKAYYLRSWIHSLSFLRNLCAHHSRIWNKTFPILPNLTDKQNQSVLHIDRLAGFCTVMADLLSVLGKKDNFRHDLQKLFNLYPQVPVSKLGFADGWEKGPIWK